jgi:Flp pilus assembly CpaE family ATPase
MFNAVVILGSAESAPLIRSLLAATGQVTVMRELPAPPGRYELARIVNSLLPDLIFIDMSGGQEALECMARIHEMAPQIPVIALGCNAEGRMLARHLGAAAFSAPDCSPDELRQTIREALEAHHGGIEKNLYSFLPSKAGSGCSTVVLHTALAAAAFGKKVLVIDADLRSSVMGLLLGVTPVGGTQAVLHAAANLDKFVLRRNLTERHGVDFLLSTRELDVDQPEWVHYFQLLNFVRDQYDLILADLPELINPATVELVRRSKMIFLVSTPELPPLKLAMQRLNELERLGITEDRIGLLINRVSRSTPQPAEIEQTLGRKVVHAFPNDYRSVSQAIHDAAPLPPGTEIAHSFSALAARLAGVEYKQPPASLRTRLKGLLPLTSA